MKNLILHGYEDNNDTCRTLRDKIIEVFHNMPNIEESGTEFFHTVAYTKRLGRVVGTRPVLIEFVNIYEKKVNFEWKKEVEEMGYKIADDYTKEERQVYARFKEMKKEFLKLLGEKIELVNGRVYSKHKGNLSFEEAEAIVGLASNEEKPNESCPQIGENGKRRKPVQQEKK